MSRTNPNHTDSDHIGRHPDDRRGTEITATANEREAIRVRGIVQGVGFRPLVYRLAVELGLGGLVGNDSDGVFIELIGSAPQRDALISRLTATPPPLARIDSIERGGVTLDSRFEPFHIVNSDRRDHATTRVAPDSAVCVDCLFELFDPADRRFGHPFITCTNCGPRFTIITGLPYDRPRTTMAAFEMCDACRTEYCDPTNRRYHAQPIGCHDCGPSLSWHDWTENTSEKLHRRVPDADAIDAAAAALRRGQVVAVKGIGGYHLVANAADDDAVASIRSRKHRPDKPFAVMVSNVGAARRIAQLDDAFAHLLSSAAAPIVLLERRTDPQAAPLLSPLIAPGNPLVGVMLAYTPVHHLLFAQSGLDALVVTSANHSGEPLLYRDDPETMESLGRLADGVLTHDRVVRVPVDDSVVRLVASKLLPVRIGRGYAPIVLPLPHPQLRDVGENSPTVLAVGGELKNTTALTTSGQVWMSAHIGDMGNLDTLRAFERSADQLESLTGATPTTLAHDMHPGYHTTGWAKRRSDGIARTDLIAVQHHHAHIAAVATEHGVDRPVLGVAYDGTGYGPDGSIWGGEFLYCDGAEFVRAGHLATIDLPGGDAAITHPWRAALAHLRAAGIDWTDDLPVVAAVEARERTLFDTQLQRRFGTVATSSMGRLFDAVASLVGVRHAISYEAQAAIELEYAARRGDPADGYSLDWSMPASWSLGDDPIVLDPTPMLIAIVADLRAGVPIETIAARTHRGVADATMLIAQALAVRLECDTIALCGGVFQNALFTERCLTVGATKTVETVVSRRPTIITHHIVPPNDGGLALGQAAIAAYAVSDGTYAGAPRYQRGDAERRHGSSNPTLQAHS